MHPRVESLPKPDPDYRRFLDTIARKDVGRVPLIELAVHPEVVAELYGEGRDAAAGLPLTETSLRQEEPPAR